MSIQVEDEPAQPEKPGQCLTLALVGPHGDLFEIWHGSVTSRGLSSVGTTYWINDVRVDRDVYRDCLETSSLNRYCPGCGGDAGGDEPEGEPAEAS